MEKKNPNALIHESSPYLLQHAYNPVNWHPWNNESLDLAIEENKLLLISVGYSACHWCHVMEHESFEDTEVAHVMNENYINIKVDREERPDVDQVYMNAVQVMTGAGGWPMNIVALPDGRPVWGGTYFQKKQWIEALTQISRLYDTQP
ncbi:MAG: thioredoxin domain-containing protein, partial [Gramella sp.]|nr:thioredoxin domain-containing protein [Christiangramia sp.]